MSNNKKTSLWKLLAKHDIVVPIIQRDYAQGRKGKEDLRSRFLSCLLRSLEDGEETKLDFVYGGVENNQMMPLDGQQRLTTLWLLHWYIAFRANKLKEGEVSKRLKKFYYATRPSSTEFCRRMIDEFCKIEDGSKISEVVEYIKNQHWYYSYYNNDPTIQAILMMIEGDYSKDEKGNEKINNGLEQFFVGNDSTFNVYWEKLISDACPIQFYHQDMIGDDMPLVDDLYIKMNARGKQLTNFENFKAELIGYDKNDFKLDIVNNENDKQFVSNLDNSWMNIFWPYKKDDYNRVDEIYYRFINQLMLSYYLIKNSNKIKVKDEEKEIDKTPLYSLLENGSKFNKIEDYECVLDDDFKDMLFHTLNGIDKCARKVENKDLKRTLNEYLKQNLGYYLSFSNTIDFIPQYVNKDVYEDQDNLPTTTLGQIPQVIFFAICRFFEKWDTEQSEWKEETCVKLQDWVRFCYNICYNPLVNTVNGMQGALKVIYEISNKLCCLDIYGSLCELESFDNISLESKVARDQIEEEFYKAKYQKDNDELKQEFIEAEKFSFFKGCIRFMLWNEGKDYVGTLFEEKYKRVQELFSKEDTLEGKIHNKDSFAQYLCACTKLENIISSDNNGNGCIRFNNSGEAWKSMLANTSLCDVTHRFLCKQIQPKEDLIEKLSKSIDNSDIADKDMEKNRMKYVIETLLENDFMIHLESLDAIVSGVLFLRKNYEWALYPKNAKADRKVIVLGTSRNKVLKQLLDNNENVIQTPNHVENSSMFFGWNIPFKYGDQDFVWKWNHQIEYKNDYDEVKNLGISFNIEYDKIIEILNGIQSSHKQK